MSQFPVFNAGSRITATGLTSMEPFVGFKTTTLARANTTTLTVDTDFTLSNLQNGTYIIDGVFHFTGAVTPADLKIGTSFSGTVSGIVNWLGPLIGTSTAATFTAVAVNGGAASIGTFGVATTYTLRLNGAMVITAPGDLTLLWAQNSSSATATSVWQDSYMRVQQIA